MNKNIELIDFPDDKVAEEYVRRGLGNASLDGVTDFDIGVEFENRGLGEDYLFELADDELIQEVKSRGLEPYMFGFDSDVLTLAEKIRVDIHQDLCVKNRVIALIEEITGKLVCR